MQFARKGVFSLATKRKLVRNLLISIFIIIIMILIYMIIILKNHPYSYKLTVEENIVYSNAQLVGEDLLLIGEKKAEEGENFCTQGYIRKVNQQGEMLWENEIQNEVNKSYSSIVNIEFINNEFIAVGKTIIANSCTNTRGNQFKTKSTILKLNYSGEVIDQKIIEIENARNINVVDIIIVNDSVVTIVNFLDEQNREYSALIQFDLNLNKLKESIKREGSRSFILDIQQSDSLFVHYVTYNKSNVPTHTILLLDQNIELEKGRIVEDERIEAMLVHDNLILLLTSNRTNLYTIKAYNQWGEIVWYNHFESNLNSNFETHFNNKEYTIISKRFEDGIDYLEIITLNTKGKELKRFTFKKLEHLNQLKSIYSCNEFIIVGSRQKSEREQGFILRLKVD